MFDLMPFEHRYNNLMRNFERDMFKDFGAMMSGMNTDIADKGDHYLLEAELPGFDKGDIKIDIDGDRLTISAEHDESHEENNKKNKYIRRERSYGSYMRSFDISNVKSEEIDAEYKNGILSVKLPKKEETSAPKTRRIDIK